MNYHYFETRDDLGVFTDWSQQAISALLLTLVSTIRKFTIKSPKFLPTLRYLLATIKAKYAKLLALVHLSHH